MSAPEAKPRVCPCCEKPVVGKILVCGLCWWIAHPVDRAKFRAQYARNPKNPAAWSAIGEKIIHTIKEKLGRT